MDSIEAGTDVEWEESDECVECEDCVERPDWVDDDELGEVESDAGADCCHEYEWQ